ncbi:MAG: ECF transporter S component [Clostridia bacterium]|nr:ECF transporter S component [Clostridia bacterium]
MNQRTKQLTTVAMLCAMSYAVMVIGRIPIVLFLKYEPKDVLITIGGFLFGPLCSFVISLVVSLVEMVTVSDTGIIGCVMNLISSCAFACSAAVIYKKKHTLSGAVWGLLVGCLAMTAVMLLWNYLITPLYMGMPRQAVAELLLPAFLPFNLLKGGLNMAITLLLYKPVVKALRKTKLVEESAGTAAGNKKIGIWLVAVLLLATCVLAAMAWKGLL